ncbi:MAG TPA: hypothetical protein VFX39_06980 [Gemmatimonadaceae bacterium]|nr:hypothetical protein [Gemmatimonadaceae bacterium]
MPSTPASDFAPPELRPEHAPEHAPERAPERAPRPLPERRGRGQRRVAWFAARARNALRRPGRLGAVAGGVFTVALLSLILVPRQAQRAFAELAPRPDEWRDSAAALAAVGRAQAGLEAARRSFAAARAAATAPPPAPIEARVQLTAEQLRQRDSLESVVGNLRRGLARVERAPLPASYRALGELPELAGNPRVRALLDSLSAVEREREEFAALGGVDPIYVALTTRVNAIGRDLQGVATASLSEAADALRALELPPPAPVAVVERPPVDTLGPLQRVVGAEEEVRRAEAALATVRQTNERLVQRATEAQQAANFVAPPMAILGAAVVLALVAGYAAVLVGEVRRPRVADAAEVERECGCRVLAVVRPGVVPLERDRRRGDERTPDLLSPNADSYRLLYLHLSPVGESVPFVTVTGSDPSVVAAVAANLAAAAAQDARSPLLVDADLATGAAGGLMRVRPAPGMTELLRGEAEWSETIRSALFGRERVVDVIPAGAPVRTGREPAPDPAFRQDMLRMARRYDLTVVAAPLAHVVQGARSILLAPDVLLCARASDTPIHDLQDSLAALHGAGLRIHGVVLWDGDAPHLDMRGIGAARRGMSDG